MIPPMSNIQCDNKNNLAHMVPWQNTFNMRQFTLQNLSSSYLGLKNGSKASIQNHRRSYSVNNASKSLDVLRKNLQSAINKEIEALLKKYLDTFFQPAIINIKDNLGIDSVNEDHLREVCKQILEEAKSIYNSPSSFSNGLLADIVKHEVKCEIKTEEFMEKMDHVFQTPAAPKRKDLEMDPEQTVSVTTKRSRSKLLSNYYNDNLGCKFSLKRDGPKWNPGRIKANTMFIMGSRANKVLGYGQTRGRLYVRHPNLLRYCGDQEDKEWLQSQNLLPANGGKIYIMLLEDIKELTESDEYRNSANLQLHELQGFEVPSFMSEKIKNYLEYIKTEKKLMAVLDIDDNSDTPPPNVTIMNHTLMPPPLDKNDKNAWRTSQLRQQIDYPNMSSDMSSLSSSVISSILAGTYTPVSTFSASSDNNVTIQTSFQS